MKTLQEFYTEIMASDELKKSFVQAAKENKQLEFVKERGVETTADELNTFLVEKEKEAENSKLSENELNSAAGGNLLNISDSFSTHSAGCHVSNQKC